MGRLLWKGHRNRRLLDATATLAGLELSHKESWATERGRDPRCTIPCCEHLCWWKGAAALQDEPGCTHHGAHHAFKAVQGPVVASNGLRFSVPIHPGSSSLQKPEINLSSESQSLILFLANFLSYMTVMLDNYMHQATVQTVKIKLLPGTISSKVKHNLN